MNSSNPSNPITQEPNYRIVTADHVPESKLDDFLRKVYSKPKSDFLISHGTWWYRGNQNRLAILIGNEVAAYCAIIPTTCLINGAEEPAAWWVDLIIDPKFRGQGIQTIIDQEIRHTSETKLGFPNELAIKIHQKHGWGVREDLQVLMLPLQPLNVKNVREAGGVQGSLLRSAAFLAIPLASRVLNNFINYYPSTAQALENPSAEILEGIFQKYKKDDIPTTYRDAEHVRWRYLKAPYRSELAFYIAGPNSSPTHFLILRHIRFSDIVATRILDMFGDFANAEESKDILKLAVKDSILQGSSQVTVMVTLPELRRLLRSLGFLIGVGSRFCWYSTSRVVMEALGRKCHWTLADSDNDAPD